MQIISSPVSSEYNNLSVSHSDLSVSIISHLNIKSSPDTTGFGWSGG